MTSWVYIFSKFTPEALLFEALIIFLLCCGYTAFWVLRKRRYGSVDTTVPSGPVKAYLNELILNSEQLRLQLFGLLAASDHSAASLYRLVGLPGPAQGGATDADLARKLAEMEAKLLEQLRALEALAAEKARLEKELAEARSAKPGGEGGEDGGALIATGKEDAGVIVRLQQRIQDLESKLAEYNVIEDDLANLKRLQQENNLLKSTLTAKGIPIPAPGTSAPVAWPTPNAADPAADSATAPTAATEAAPAPPATAGAEPDAFASLAGQVESSLQSAAPAEPAAPSEASPPAPAAEAAPPPSGDAEAAAAPPQPVKSENEKSEADLVAEFEKMLKG